ncbi:hypothetical protein GV829_11105 [Sphingomonas lacunae]|uniref:Uncharacterized protein n=1 Tax=Sphingomonas lacunae TaxID=2698828 RepID=A0A6M4AV50_9SPHN|nr:hypothetical protein [Sphingomonas lacunae]QJQ32924.1 hypothetical protein GV829_11105 [Sphingomonas lacunae]
MDSRQHSALFRFISHVTVICGLFAAMYLLLSDLVPGGPVVEVMIFGGTSILVAHVLMLAPVARYTMALFLTAMIYFAVRYVVVTVAFAGDASEATLALTVIGAVHLPLMVLIFGLLDESALFGTVCPQCEARGAVSEEVVDRYREGRGGRSHVVAQRIRVTTKHKCRKCEHVWFERAFTFDD